MRKLKQPELEPIVVEVSYLLTSGEEYAPRWLTIFQHCFGEYYYSSDGGCFDIYDPLNAQHVRYIASKIAGIEMNLANTEEYRETRNGPREPSENRR